MPNSLLHINCLNWNGTQTDITPLSRCLLNGNRVTASVSRVFALISREASKSVLGSLKIYLAMGFWYPVPCQVTIMHYGIVFPLRYWGSRHDNLGFATILIIGAILWVMKTGKCESGSPLTWMNNMIGLQHNSEKRIS